MTRRLPIFVVACLLFPALGRAQEVGAGKIEIESALFGGGALFIQAAPPRSVGYVFDAAANENVGRRIGLEGDFAWAMSRQRAIALDSLTPLTERTPNMLFYTANLVISPTGHDHKFVPYVELGGGGLSVLGSSGQNPYGIASNSTHLTGNLGGGMRWFPIPHWGVRVDYRYIGIRNGNAPVIAGIETVHHAQRLYGALVLTF